MTQISVCLTCDGYWNRFKLSLESLQRARTEYGIDALIVVATSDEHIPELAADVEGLVICQGNDRHMKASQLSRAMAEAIKIRGCFHPILLTDADIIHHPNALATFQWTATIDKGCFLSSRRSCLDEWMTQSLLSHELPCEDGLKCLVGDDRRPSPYMGWFQGLGEAWTKDVFEFLLWWKGRSTGYKDVDYAIAHEVIGRSIHLRGKRFMARWDRPALHLHHGADGANWAGCEQAL